MSPRRKKTSAQQLAYVRDWERRNPERAQERKDRWAQSPKGLAWLRANQEKKNAARKAWRERMRAEGKRPT